MLDTKIRKEDKNTKPGVINLLIMKPTKVMVYLKSEHIPTDFTILPQILQIDPIMGDHRTCVEIDNPTIFTAAKRSGMRIYEYLSTIYNLEYVKESGYRDMLNRKYGGLIEVPIPGIGRIDVLTPDKIIEVKTVNLWKGGLGQLLVYAIFYPKHQPVLALTPAKTCYKIEEIERIVNSFGVEIMLL